MEAESPEEAIPIALSKLELYSLLKRQNPVPGVEYTEYAEEVREVLVDVAGDEEYEHSCWFLWHRYQWMRAPRDLKEELRLLEEKAADLRKQFGLETAEQKYSRTWKCPDCGRTADVSYENLAEVGTPICPDCDIEMKLL